MLNKYPIWKNVFILLLLFAAIFYALPNIYGEDPAIEIKPSDKTTIDSVYSAIQNIFDEYKLEIKSVVVDKSAITVRFKSTDSELNIADKVRSLLNDRAIVSMNILPSTPAWLNFIGAKPMKLGLDLVGGIHFSLKMDTNQLFNSKLKSKLRNLQNELREAYSIRCVGNVVESKNQLNILFKNKYDFDLAYKYIKTHETSLDIVQDSIKSNDSNFVMNLAFNENRKIDETDAAVQQAMITLRNRVNELGIAESTVQKQGTDKISVDLPGIQDSVRAQEIIGSTATLEFRLVDEINDPRQAQVNNIIPPGDSLYFYENRPVLLKDQVILSGKSIVSAVSGYSDNNGIAVDISIGDGGAYFRQMTADNVGKLLAIVYTDVSKQVQILKNGEKVVVPKQNSRVINIATIKSALPSNFQITGLNSYDEAKNLALLLRAGALPAPIYIAEERTLGPELGAENIKKGIDAILAGFFVAVFFMFIYYRIFGLIANLALFANIIFLSAVLSIFGMTMTLPGMAAMVLTVCMAVDANVLIFERIREDLRKGIQTQMSIHLGYDRAFSTILDANVTTLIAALVLFGIGTGPIKGFAITLCFGLVTSMFSAIVFTRLIVNIIYGGKKNKKISIGI